MTFLHTLVREARHLVFLGALAATACGGDPSSPLSGTTPPPQTSPPPQTVPPPQTSPPPQTLPPPPTPPPTSGQPPPAATLSAQTTSLYLGESVVLFWGIFDAPTPSMGSCMASGGWSGTVGFSGSQAVTPSNVGNITYTITCSDGAGNTGLPSSTTVTVHPANTNGYLVTQLVADTAGGSVHVDANLIQPWGVATFPAGFGDTAAGGLQVVNAGSSTITAYDSAGMPLTSVDEPSSFFMGNFASQLHPTGLARNLRPDSAFAPGPDIQCGETHYFVAAASGVLAGFTLGCGTFSLYTAGDGAVYMGVTADTQQVYLTDFHNGKIDVFNSSLQKVELTSTQFVDPTLPANYSPFGIRAVCSADQASCSIYVTYAQRDSQLSNTAAVGSGLGLVDVFTPGGDFVTRLVQPGGTLNAPWGMAMAPPTFGSLSNALLVGNIGDGTINGYDPVSGQSLGAVTISSGMPFAFPGLRGLDFSFPSEASDTASDTLFFTVAPSAGDHGMIGSIRLPRP